MSMSWEEYAGWLEKRLCAAEAKIKWLTDTYIEPFGMLALVNAYGFEALPETSGGMKFHNDCGDMGFVQARQITVEEYLDSIDVSREMQMLFDRNPAVKAAKHDFNEYLHQKLEEFNRRKIEEENS